MESHYHADTSMCVCHRYPGYYCRFTGVLTSFLLYLDTSEFLHANPQFVEDQSQVEKVACNKDTGGLKAFHSWSRGMFFIISAGGHIEYWQPLYRYATV